MDRPRSLSPALLALASHAAVARARKARLQGPHKVDPLGPWVG